MLFGKIVFSYYELQVFVMAQTHNIFSCFRLINRNDVIYMQSAKNRKLCIEMSSNFIPLKKSCFKVINKILCAHSNNVFNLACIRSRKPAPIERTLNEAVHG